MPCLSCDEQKDKAYNEMLFRKLSIFFSDHPCVDCGETDLDVLDFSGSQAVWQAVADKTPWTPINRMLQSAVVRCGNCERRTLADNVGKWGLKL